MGGLLVQMGAAQDGGHESPGRPVVPLPIWRTVGRWPIRDGAAILIWWNSTLLALGLNHWIDPSVESMGEFYWGDENADDAGLPDLWFP